MHKIIRYYLTKNGKSPFLQWLAKISDALTRARINRRIERLILNNYGDYKSIGEGIYELRLDFGTGYRIYFAEQDEIVVILLCAGNKSTQQQDIVKAKSYWQSLRKC